MVEVAVDSGAMNIKLILIVIFVAAKSDGQLLRALKTSASLGSSEELRRHERHHRHHSRERLPSNYVEPSVYASFGPTALSAGVGYGSGQNYDPRSYQGQPNYYGLNPYNQNPYYNQGYQPRPGFPFNLIPTTTPPPFPFNLIPTLPNLIPNPTDLLYPTTPRPFPFNLWG